MTSAIVNPLLLGAYVCIAACLFCSAMAVRQWWLTKKTGTQ